MSSPTHGAMEEHDQARLVLNLVSENPTAALVLTFFIGAAGSATTAYGTPALRNLITPALRNLVTLAPTLVPLFAAPLQLVALLLQQLSPEGRLSSAFALGSCIAYLSLSLRSLLILLGPASLVFVVALDACRPVVKRTGRGWKSRAGPELGARVNHYCRLFMLWLAVVGALLASTGISFAAAALVTAAITTPPPPAYPSSPSPGAEGAPTYRRPLEPRREPPHREPSRAEPPRAEQPRAEQPRWEQPRREQPRREQPRRKQPRREQPPSDEPSLPCTEGKLNAGYTCRCSADEVSLEEAYAIVRCCHETIKRGNVTYPGQQANRHGWIDQDSSGAIDQEELESMWLESAGADHQPAYLRLVRVPT